MLSHSCCVLLGLLSISISVVAFTSPSASHKPQPLGDLPDVSIPKPTEGPNNEELKRRQEYGPQRTLIAAPDNTCGFFNGSSAMPWGCSTGHCVFATPTTTVVTATTTNGTSLGTSLSTVVNGVASILCCDPSTGCPAAAAPTACVDKGRNDYDTLCTGSCPSDPATLKCTSGIYLYCNTVAFQAPAVSAYFCNYISTYAILSASTAYAGQTNHAFTPTIAQFVYSIPAPSATLEANGTASVSTSSSGTPGATNAAGSGGKKPVNKKVVIGAVVGSLGGLALVAGLWFFMRWRNTPYAAEEIAPPPVEEVKVQAKAKNVSFVGHE